MRKSGTKRTFIHENRTKLKFVGYLMRKEVLETAIPDRLKEKVPSRKQ